MATIRAAQLGDMPAVGRIYVSGHWTAYRGHVPYGHLRAMDPGEEGAVWAHELTHPGGIFLVAVNDRSRVIGFAYGGMRLATLAVLAELFVEWRYRGKGVAQSLLARFAQRVQPAGATSLRSAVAMCNGRSRSFCTKTGAHEVDLGDRFPVFDHVAGKDPIQLRAVYEDWHELAGLAAGHVSG